MIGCENLYSPLRDVRQRVHRKAGHNGSGTQQYLCKACGAHRVLAPKRPPASAQRQQEILRAVGIEPLSLRAAERVFGVARQTIAKWLEKKPELSRR